MEKFILTVQDEYSTFLFGYRYGMHGMRQVVDGEAAAMLQIMAFGLKEIINARIESQKFLPGKKDPDKIAAQVMQELLHYITIAQGSA